MFLKLLTLPLYDSKLTGEEIVAYIELTTLIKDARATRNINDGLTTLLYPVNVTMDIINTVATKFMNAIISWDKSLIDRELTDKKTKTKPKTAKSSKGATNDQLQQ